MVQTELYSCKFLVLCQLVCFLEEGFSGDLTLLFWSVNTVKSFLLYFLLSFLWGMGGGSGIVKLILENFACKILENCYSAIACLTVFLR